MRPIDRFIDSILEAARTPPSFAVGTVTAYTAGPPKTIDVDWNGSIIPGLPWPKSSTYTPVVGDVVLMARFGSQLLPTHIY